MQVELEVRRKALRYADGDDIVFDQVIMDSMAKVVASANLRAAAENEGQALLITKTKAAEAEGRAIQISAEAQREASRLQGQGVAQFREEMAKGVRQSIEQMRDAGLDPSFLLFFMWTEAVKHFAEQGKGNVIFLDGSAEGMQTQFKQMMAMNQLEQNSRAATGTRPPVPVPRRPTEG